MSDGVCVCGQWILRVKFRIVNWKYVTLRFGILKFNMTDGVCFVCGQGILRYKCSIFNWKYATLGVGTL